LSRTSRLQRCESFHPGERLSINEFHFLPAYWAESLCGGPQSIVRSCTARIWHYAPRSMRTDSSPSGAYHQTPDQTNSHRLLQSSECQVQRSIPKLVASGPGGAPNNFSILL